MNDEMKEELVWCDEHFYEENRECNECGKHKRNELFAATTYGASEYCEYCAYNCYNIVECKNPCCENIVNKDNNDYCCECPEPGSDEEKCDSE